MTKDKKSHWEQVYQTKTPEQVSWTQEIPQTSLDFINSLNLPKSAKIIDIGGGDSTLVDHLLQAGFADLTVLDISEAALQKAKARLGNKGDLVKWIVSDITEFHPKESYDLWHDRATFHFLTGEDQVNAYLTTMSKTVNKYLVIGTFSENGPEKCSGLPVRQYSQLQLKEQFSEQFENIKCITEDHITPLQTTQNFTFCSFKKR